jgi:hypothetical protein
VSAKGEKVTPQFSYINFKMGSRLAGIDQDGKEPLYRHAEEFSLIFAIEILLADRMKDTPISPSS